tara:strand:- start:54 stop:1268 length:1215 start_codon:yes stop_codon:yes gene_type:complete
MGIEDTVEEVRSDIRTFNEEQLVPIKERLASLEERDSSPTDNTVADLEKRLIEGEQKLEEMNEQIRLAQVEGGLIPATEKSSDPFKGVYFKDVDAMRNELLHGESRSLTLSDISASAGLMPDETASAFLDFVVGDQATLSRIETKVMSSPTARLDRIGVASRGMRLITELTDVPDTDGVSFTAHNLSVVESGWAENLSLSFLEDNIAAGNAESAIASAVAKTVGEDLNDLAWNGDSATAGFLIQNSGFETLFAADADVNDTASQTGVTDPTTVLSALYKAVPAEYRMLAGQSMFVSPAFATGYMDNQSARATALGDAVLTGGSAGLSYFGVPIIVERHLPEANAYMSPVSNLVFGVHRAMTQEMEWQPRSREVQLTITIRSDYEYKWGGVVGRAHTIDGDGLIS